MTNHKCKSNYRPTPKISAFLQDSPLAEAKNNADLLVWEDGYRPQVDQVVVWACAFLIEPEGFGYFEDPVGLGQRSGDEHFATGL